MTPGLGSTTPNSFTTTPTTLAGTVATIDVTVTTAGGVSFTSPADQFTYIAAPTAPAAPTGLAASKDTYADKVQVTWTASAGATGYDVYRNTTNSSGTATKLNASDITTTTYDDTAAVPDVTYYYWIVARNSAGSSVFSTSDTGLRTAMATEAEPNNLYATAQNLGSVTGPLYVSAGLSSAGDIDWYKFTLPALGGTNIAIAFTGDFGAGQGIALQQSVQQRPDRQQHQRRRQRKCQPPRHGRRDLLRASLRLHGRQLHVDGHAGLGPGGADGRVGERGRVLQSGDRQLDGLTRCDRVRRVSKHHQRPRHVGRDQFHLHYDYHLRR